MAHDGYEARFGVRHVRQVELLDEDRVVDHIEGTGRHHVRLSYLLGHGLTLDPEQPNQVIDSNGQKVVSFNVVKQWIFKCVTGAIRRKVGSQPVICASNLHAV